MKTLLVVDDEPVVRQLVSASLAGDEWQVLTAADGPSAIDAARNDHPDLILLDVSLPGLPGTEVLTRLRNEVATASIPVLYLTGLAPDLGPRPDGVLAKPFTPSTLRQTLAAFA